VHLLALLRFITLTVAVAFGVGAALSALCAMYRDVRYVVRSRSALDVRIAGDLSGPLRARSLAVGVLSQPDGRVIDGFRASCSGCRSTASRSASSCVTTLVIGWLGCPISAGSRVARRSHLIV